MNTEIQSLEDFKPRELGFRVHMLAKAIYGLIGWNGSMKAYAVVLRSGRRINPWICGAWNHVHCFVEDVVWDIGSDTHGFWKSRDLHELEGAMKQLTRQAQEDNRSNKEGDVPSPAECARRILAARDELQRFENFVRPYYRDPYQLKRRFRYMNRLLGNAAKYAERYGQEVPH